jgi:antitoxin ParD1/3/4
MNISLTKELEMYITEKVTSGRYQTASEVVRAGLRLLEKNEEEDTLLARLRAEAQIGIDQVARGEYTEYDDNSLREFFEEVKRTGREELGLLEA